MMILITADFCPKERGRTWCTEGCERRKDMRKSGRRNERGGGLLKDGMRGEAGSM